MALLTGRISQIIGPVVDVHFNLPEDEQAKLPSIHEALQITRKDGSALTIEVQQHIGEDTVRTVAMDSTDGLRRGMRVRCTGTTTNTASAAYSTAGWAKDRLIAPP